MTNSRTAALNTPARQALLAAPGVVAGLGEGALDALLRARNAAERFSAEQFLDGLAFAWTTFAVEDYDLDALDGAIARAAMARAAGPVNGANLGAWMRGVAAVVARV